MYALTEYVRLDLTVLILFGYLILCFIGEFGVLLYGFCRVLQL